MPSNGKVPGSTRGKVPPSRRSWKVPQLYWKVPATVEKVRPRLQKVPSSGKVFPWVWAQSLFLGSGKMHPAGTVTNEGSYHSVWAHAQSGCMGGHL